MSSTLPLNYKLASLARLGFLCGSLLACSVRAQNYSIDWSTIDGGGDTSTGGSYALTGTIGQPDAGILSGGNYTLQGGFWPGLIVPGAGERPTLLIQLSGTGLSISWYPATTGFALQEADDPASPTWTPVAHGDTSPVVISPTSRARFYRLCHP